MISNFSQLPKTWIIDIDGVIFKHNAYLQLKDNELEKPLPGVQEFFEKIPEKDLIILITARSKKYKKITIKSLKAANLRYNIIIFDAPVGERILINDKKPDGLLTAYSFNLERDKGLISLIE